METIDRNLHPVSCLTKHIQFSNTLIRYIMVSDIKYADLLCDYRHCIGFPLFLAKDVFSTCDLKQSNVQRIHARYSKNGLATKVFLEDFRMDGICQNRMWFYSIQGLFEVIFHYHKRDQQKDCLKLLANVWLPHSDDEMLPENMSVRLDQKTTDAVVNDNGFMCKSSPSQNQPFSKKGNISMENEQSLVNTETMNCLNHVDEHSKAVKSMAHFKSTQENITSYDTEEIARHSTSEVYTQTDKVMIDSVPADVTSNYVTVAQQTDDILVNQNLSNPFEKQNLLCGILSVAKTNIGSPQTARIQGSVNTKCPYCLYFEKHDFYQNPSFVTCLVKLNQFIMFMYTESEQEFLQIFSEVMSMFLDNYPKLVMPDSFLIEFLEMFKNFDSNFDEVKRDDIFLNLMCKWLGKELHKFEHQISENVTNFMQNHIHCIDNLPPPEEIINEIFPSCMKELVYYWMYSVNNKTEIANDAEVNNQKRFKFCTDNKPNFQVIQLILEFANNALISGVAHVVFSRITLNNC